MSTLQEYRQRAVNLLCQKVNSNVPQQIDYQIDDLLRSLLKLPARPQGQAPYSGWMVSSEQTTETKRHISGAGLDLIKRYEGCRTNAYLCPAKVWTIGYGHTKTARAGLKISQTKAEELLWSDLAVYEQAVIKLVSVPLSQPQFDALVSFAFNVGTGALASSTLLSLLNRSNYLGAAEQLLRWTKADKVTLPGLVQRRRAEYELFMS